MYINTFAYTHTHTHAHKMQTHTHTPTHKTSAIKTFQYCSIQWTTFVQIPTHSTGILLPSNENDSNNINVHLQLNIIN